MLEMQKWYKMASSSNDSSLTFVSKTSHLCFAFFDSRSNMGLEFCVDSLVVIKFYTRLQWNPESINWPSIPFYFAVLNKSASSVLFIDTLKVYFLPFSPITVFETAFLAHFESKSNSTPETNST